MTEQEKVVPAFFRTKFEKILQILKNNSEAQKIQEIPSHPVPLLLCFDGVHGSNVQGKPCKMANVAEFVHREPILLHISNCNIHQQNSSAGCKLKNLILGSSATKLGGEPDYFFFNISQKLLVVLRACIACGKRVGKWAVVPRCQTPSLRPFASR